ncbi:hypothetical protein QOT17_015769 [Balamuthia mandrillaris]
MNAMEDNANGHPVAQAGDSSSTQHRPRRLHPHILARMKPEHRKVTDRSFALDLSRFMTNHSSNGQSSTSSSTPPLQNGHEQTATVDQPAGWSLAPENGSHEPSPQQGTEEMQQLDKTDNAKHTKRQVVEVKDRKRRSDARKQDNRKTANQGTKRQREVVEEEQKDEQQEEEEVLVDEGAELAEEEEEEEVDVSKPTPPGKDDQNGNAPKRRRTESDASGGSSRPTLDPLTKKRERDTSAGTPKARNDNNEAGGTQKKKKTTKKRTPITQRRSRKEPKLEITYMTEAVQAAMEEVLGNTEAGPALRKHMKRLKEELRLAFEEVEEQVRSYRDAKTSKARILKQTNAVKKEMLSIQSKRQQLRADILRVEHRHAAAENFRKQTEDMHDFLCDVETMSLLPLESSSSSSSSSSTSTTTRAPPSSSHLEALVVLAEHHGRTMQGLRDANTRLAACLNILSRHQQPQQQQQQQEQRHPPFSSAPTSRMPNEK